MTDNYDALEEAEAYEMELQRKDEEIERLRGALRTLIASCDAGRRVKKFGVGGMTVQTNIRSSWIHNVEAWAVEEARAALEEKE